MIKSMVKKYLMYLLRWQLSTPILAICLSFFHFGNFWNTVLANLIGGLIFFWVDRLIFSDKKKAAKKKIERESQVNPAVAEE